MKKFIKKLKGKKVLSLLLALIMVLSVASPAMSPLMGIVAKAVQKVENGNTVELALDNLFIFEQWANSKMSGTLPGNFKGVYNENIGAGSVTLNNNQGEKVFYTGFDFQTCAFYYTIPVEGNTKYNFSFAVAGGDYASYVFYYDKGYKSLGDAPEVGFDSKSNINNWDFVTPAKAAYIQVRFDCNTPNTDITFSNIRICKAGTYTGTPVRATFTAGKDTYSLPTPDERTGYVFGGWYTGENGTGERITNQTPVENLSFSVFARWDEKVAENGLSIKTKPTKTQYAKDEKLDTTGLVLNAVVGGKTKEIPSGFTCSPEVLNSVGTQPITVTYGGQTATFNVEVKASLQTDVVYTTPSTTTSIEATITTQTDGNDTYTVYTFNKDTSAFNYYGLTYKTSSYMKGIITTKVLSAEGGVEVFEEEFFLEPSNNGNFSSYISDFFTVNDAPYRNYINTIKFEYLDKNQGDFRLLSVNTDNKVRNYSDDVGNKIIQSEDFKVGINLIWGGTLSYLEDLKNNPKATADTTNGTKIEEDANNSTKHGLNLINTYDRGRYAQSAYYGTEDPDEYVRGKYGKDKDGNRQLWPYNPVQGGNRMHEEGDTDSSVYDQSSKVVDYKITEDANGNVTEIYVKTQALDWAKPKEYITPSYMETRYVFEHGMVKAYCRFIDFSGYKYAIEKRQEIPAVYPIEPFDTFVYYSGAEAWSSANAKQTVSSDQTVDANAEFDLDFDNTTRNPESFLNVNEKWAAFIDSSSDYGLGVYSSRSDGFSAGMFRPYGDNVKISTDADPTNDNPSAYLTPFATYKMESYKPEEYTYYITTGSPEEIRNDFGLLVSEEYAARASRPKIAVPETIYMTPSTGASTTGQYFVNNSIDGNGLLTTEAKNNATKGIISVYSPGSTAIKFSVNRISGSNIGDPVIGNGTVGVTYEDQRWEHSAIYGAYGTGSSKDWFLFNDLGLAIDGTGLSATGTATLEWIVTVYYGDDDTVGETHYAYSTLYAPYYLPVGAVAQADAGYHDPWASSILWVSGVHSSTTGGYYVQPDNFIPMFNKIKTPNNNQAQTYWIQSGAVAGFTPTMNYNSYTTSGGLTSSSKYHVRVNTVSPTANLTVDVSRYANLSQIPNLKIGYMIIDQSNTTTNDCGWWLADYTGNNNGYGTSTDNGDSQFTTEWSDSAFVGTRIDGESGRQMGDPVYNAPWDKDVNGSTSFRLKAALKSCYSATITTTAWNNLFVDINVSGVNKAELRDLVIECSGLNEKDFTAESWAAFKPGLIKAAEVLGDPTSATDAVGDLKAAMSKLRANVTFDNFIDLETWKDLTPSDTKEPVYTETAITLTSEEGVGEGTFHSPYFAVTPGKQYKVDIDFAGDNWDVYFFYYAEDTTSDTAFGFSDSGNRFSSDGSGNTSQIFTPPDGTVKARIRLDANGANNTVKFSNIRVYENTGVTVSPANKYANYNNAIGTLPTPTKTGYTFVGWYDKNGNEVTAGTIVKGPMNLFSKWEEKTYPVFYSANGPDLSELKGGTVKYESNTFTLPYPTNWDEDWGDYGEFIGWSINPYADPCVDRDTNEDILKPGYGFSAKTLPDAAFNDQGQIVFHAIWKLNEKTCFVEDTGVVDFGLSTKYSPFDNDSGVAGYHRNFANEVYGVNTTGDLDTYSDSADGEYGKFTLVGDKVNYTPSEIMNGVETAYFVGSYTYKDGGVTKFKTPITVVPASNMYYEESVMTIPNAGNAAADYKWSEKGTSDSTGEVLDPEGVYGFNNAYASSTDFSDGTHYHTVLKDTGTVATMRSDTATFTFTGTGFDLVSACGRYTGIQVVKIVGTDNTTKKTIIVDTYCGDETLLAGADYINQVPIVSWTAPRWGTYNVEVTAAFLSSAKGAKTSFKNNKIDTGLVLNSAEFADTKDAKALLESAGFDTSDIGDVELVWFDDNSVLNGGTGVAKQKSGLRALTDPNDGKVILHNYIDGVRIYNPLNDDSTYYSDTEKYAVYANVINNLAEVTDGTPSFNGAFTVGELKADVEGEEPPKLSFANYQSVGPKGEFYLNAAGTVSFNVNLNDGERVMLGLRAVNGPTKYRIVSGNAQNVAVDVNSATEMYYDITECLGTINNGVATITIENAGSNILAVNHVKLSGAENTGNSGFTPRSVSRSGDTATEVTTDKFLPITEDDLVKIQNSLANETIPGIVVNGVVKPVYPDAPEVDDTETTEPEGGNTDVTEPEGGNTETTEPEGGNTDVTEPEGGNTETTEPEGGNTDVTEPEGGNTDVTEPEEDNTEVTEPDSGNTETTVPEEDNTEVTEPEEDNNSGSSDSSSSGVFDIFAVFKKFFELLKKLFSFGFSD